MAGYAYPGPFLTQGIGKFYSSSSTLSGDNFSKSPGGLQRDLNTAQLALAKAIQEYQPVTFDYESFRKLANGVFQAEGCVSAWFNGGLLTVSPVVNLGQTYSLESLSFFVRLFHELGKIGKLDVRINSSGKVFIVWHLTNWDLILSVVLRYFSGVYGEKYRAFIILEYIYKLKFNLSNDENKILLVKLVYSLTSLSRRDKGRSRKLSLGEKLYSLNLVDLKPNLEVSHPLGPQGWCNPESPSFLFFLGFLLVDGYIYIRIRMGKSGSPSFIPNIILYQKADTNSTLIFELLSKYLKSIGVKSLVIAASKTGQTSLRIEGVLAMGLLIPLFREYSSLGYWKSQSINMLLDFYQYHIAGAHTYLKGLNAVLDLIYKDPNNRTKTLEQWKEVVANYFQRVDSNYQSGFQFITPITKNKQHAGWIVSFSEKLVGVNGQKLSKIKNKSFLFSTYGSDGQALDAAINYRDSVLDLHLKELTS